MPPINPPATAAASPSTITTKSNNNNMRQRCITTASSSGGVAISTMPTTPTTNNMLSWKECQRKQLCRLGEAMLSSSGPSRAIAPIAIIGGTFSVYSSAIRISTSNNASNPNATEFTALSILYLFLLALNYAIMPHLSKRCIHPKTNKQSVALAEEVVKMSLGLGGWVLTSYVSAASSNLANNEEFSTIPTAVTTSSILNEQLQHWSPLSTLLAAGLPSALYALQGTLTYTAYQNLDAVSFNGLTQLKVLSSALCCYIILGKRQSIVQILSLGLLMTSTVVFQGSWREWFGSSNSSKNQQQQDVGKAVTSITNESNNRRLLLGVLPCLAATLLSGLAGAFSQKSLQTQVGMMHRNAYFYTVEISFLSALCLVFSMGTEWCRHRNSSAARRAANETESVVSKSNNCGKNGDSNHSASSHFFEHWTYATLLPITTKATAGLLTALVHRHLGSVIKGFALVLGLVFSALLQFALEGVDLTVGQLVGTALVLLSSWLHFTNPVQ